MVIINFQWRPIMNNDIEQKKQVIKDEIEQLRYEFKVTLPKRIAEARAYGDLKENAEYHAARERHSFVKARISQLSFHLNQMNNLKINNISENSIGYGSLVTVIDLDDENTKNLFSLVSSTEVNPAEGKISISSPIGAALSDKTAGDTVEIVIPAGKRRFYIEKIVTIHGNAIEKPYKNI